MKWVNVLILFFFVCISSVKAEEIVVGSKKFTESVVLGEVLKHLANTDETTAIHQAELGGTRILWNSLLAGNIDAYPEYSGTLIQEILANQKPKDLKEAKKILLKKGILVSAPLGFNNTYAIGMKKEEAEKRNIKKISDLVNHPDLVFGFGEEFLQRNDGWPSLKKVYQLPQSKLKGIDHDIAYRALQTGDIQAMDLYSTDAEIAYYNLTVLEDDLHYFPEYKSLILYREDLNDRAPEFVSWIKKLAGSIDENVMIRLNSQAKIDKISESKVAADFIQSRFSKNSLVHVETTKERIIRNTKEHLALLLKSLLAAIVVSIPLGVLGSKSRVFSQILMGVVGVIQTIPALALLVVLIEPLNDLGFSGIGDTPAVVALFLYSLLPIVRNTLTGLTQINPSLLESARALGLSSTQRLFQVELPLASPMILSGIKTAAVINVGFATLGALVGAGGFGQPILSGIRLDDYDLILQGALPAAGLALLVQIFFEISERWIIPKGLKSS